MDIIERRDQLLAQRAAQPFQVGDRIQINRASALSSRPRWITVEVIEIVTGGLENQGHILIVGQQIVTGAKDMPKGTVIFKRRRVFSAGRGDWRIA